MHAATRTFQPHVNTLEGRAIPSASAAVAAGKLTIDADAAGSAVLIFADGKGNVSATMRSADGTVTTKATGITQVVVRGGSGNDALDFRLTGSLLTALDLDADMGAGNDFIRADLYRGASGTPLDLDLIGGAGNDGMDLQFGTLNNVTANIRADLGAGADTCNVTMYKGASGSTKVGLNVVGGTGADRVDINMMGKIDAAATVSVRAENAVDANDRLMLRYRGELDGAMDVHVDRAASSYGTQTQFTLDAASDGALTAVVRDGKREYGSTARVTSHTGGPKVTVIDRLERVLTRAPGMAVTRFDPTAIA